MPDNSFNPLTVVQALEEANIERRQAEAIANAIVQSSREADIERRQAEAIANAIDQSNRRVLTKADFERSIATVHVILKVHQWMFGIIITVVMGLLTLAATVGDEWF